MWPLILDATGAALSPLWLGESLRNVRAEFGSEGMESKEVSELPSEEVEVLEQSLEGVSDEGLEWREHTVVLGTAGRGLGWEVLWSVSRTQRQLESKECWRCLRSELEKLWDVFRVENRSSPDTNSNIHMGDELKVVTWHQWMHSDYSHAWLEYTKANNYQQIHSNHILPIYNSLLDIGLLMDLQQSPSHAAFLCDTFPIPSLFYFCHISDMSPFVPIPLVSSFVPASLFHWYLFPCHHDPLILHI